MKKFIGGYYVENLDVEFKGLAFTEVLVLTLEEVLKHPAIENIIEDYDEGLGEEIQFENLSDEYKMNTIEIYIQDDELFTGRFYDETEVKETVAELEENAKNYEL